MIRNRKGGVAQTKNRRIIPRHRCARKRLGLRCVSTALLRVAIQGNYELASCPACKLLDATDFGIFPAHDPLYHPYTIKHGLPRTNRLESGDVSPPSKTLSRLQGPSRTRQCPGVRRVSAALLRLMVRSRVEPPVGDDPASVGFFPAHGPLYHPYTIKHVLLPTNRLESGDVSPQSKTWRNMPRPWRTRQCPGLSRHSANATAEVRRGSAALLRLMVRRRVESPVGDDPASVGILPAHDPLNLVDTKRSTHIPHDQSRERRCHAALQDAFAHAEALVCLQAPLPHHFKLFCHARTLDKVYRSRDYCLIFQFTGRALPSLK